MLFCMMWHFLFIYSSYKDYHRNLFMEVKQMSIFSLYIISFTLILRNVDLSYMFWFLVIGVFDFIAGFLWT